MAHRRVTDSARTTGRPATVLGRLAAAYTEGDTDLAWARVTLWRGLLAAALDQAPYEPVLSATVTGAPDSPSADLLAGWLTVALRCPVSLARSRNRTGIISVRLERKSGAIDLVRPQETDAATLSQPGQPDRTIALAHRSDAECLADELRRLDPDEIYQAALVDGIEQVTSSRTASQATRRGEAPSVAEAERAQKRATKARLSRSPRRGSRPRKGTSSTDGTGKTSERDG